MRIDKFLEFSHRETEKVNDSLKLFALNILLKNKSFKDLGFWNKSGVYIPDYQWID